MPKVKKTKKGSYTRLSHQISSPSLLQKLQTQFQLNESYLSLFLGFLIVLVLGILVFNYFKGNRPDLGPAGQTIAQEDVKPEDLPGKYTVKEGDTLFKIAEGYYKDGYKFLQIAETNKLADVNTLEVGQVLEIPKLVEEIAQAKTEAAETVSDEGIGGAVNQTIWGETITGDTYKVVEGDWLSKIAGRAYGDILAYEKIAKANNITNPDLIEVGTVLTIPR